MTAAEPAIAASYRELFAQPVSRRLAAADVSARLPQGMVGITLLLVAAGPVRGPAAAAAVVPAAALSAAGTTRRNAMHAPRPVRPD